MKTKTITTYSFSELDDKAKAYALKTFRSNHNNDNLHEDLDWFIEELLPSYNLTIHTECSVLYSLGYCQGDGVMFEGTFNWKDLYRVYIKHSGHYYHSGCKDVTIENISTGLEVEDDNVIKEFYKLYAEICDKAEKYGYEQIEYEETEEYILEEFDMLEAEFLSTGEMWRYN